MEPVTLLLAFTVGLLSGLALGAVGAVRWFLLRQAGAEETGVAAAVDLARVTDGLDRLQQQIRGLEQEQAAWQGAVREQVGDVRATSEALRLETSALTTALRTPHVRGQWGELHLRRAVELAGLVEHCDFDQQVALSTDDGAVRPDLVIRLAGGRSVVVDAKVPLAGYLDALQTTPGPEQERAIARHARHLRQHVDQLGAKAYWRGLPDTPEFVVLFVPSESSLGTALEAMPDLIDYAAARQVILASPTTLIALLRTVHYGWSTARLAEKAQQIHDLARELYGRIGTVGSHLAKLGRALTSSVEAYNASIGSLEQRVLVTARRLDDLGDTRQQITHLAPVDVNPRSLSAPEFLESNEASDNTEDPAQGLLDPRFGLHSGTGVPDPEQAVPRLG